MIIVTPNECYENEDGELYRVIQVTEDTVTVETSEQEVLDIDFQDFMDDLEDGALRLTESDYTDDDEA